MAETAAEREELEPDPADDPRSDERELAARDTLVQCGLSSPWRIGLL